ncbi:FadR/GntR family transcriptional regulator [Sphingobium sp.]|uniref:FadR/GntR family transcriptional regulator n=1 Tax=Sphingobium sp. TaxID=1912891 RepID=UPI002C750E92|nr:FCD domain-containing protein [Sphingobium sp.]HUD92695.1 FCD domain-containing protein [Sphingobium sp.]
MTDKEGGRTLVARVARKLAALSLGYEDGAYLGAEDELLERLGVSRPTLRQAAKIAESERMISVRRGTRGGFYATRPDVSDSIRALNRYLRLSGVTVRELTVINSVSEEAAQLAARCEDDSKRARLAEMMAQVPHLQGARAFMDFDIDFLRLIAGMSGNPVVEVLIAMSYSFGMEEQGIYLYGTPIQQAAARDLFTAIGTAILRCDGELARFMMSRRLKTIRGWIDEADPAQFAATNQIEMN